MSQEHSESPIRDDQPTAVPVPVESKGYKDTGAPRTDMPNAVADPSLVLDTTRLHVDQGWLGDRAIVLRRLFSPEECRNAMAYFDECGVTEKCLSRTDYRNNYRVVTLNESVAKVIFGRFRPFLPPTEVIDDSCGQWYVNNGRFMHGTWDIAYLNPCFRVCKYDADGHFGPHYDGDEMVDSDHRSLKTFMIYLNDDYAAGETNFLSEHELHFDAETKRYQAPPGAVRASVKAQQGDALIFDHNILHEGATVASGVKYIMRCEIMYTRRPPDMSTMSDAEQQKHEKEKAAHLLVRQAQALEAKGEEMEAVEFYRRAFKLCPEIERSL